MKTTWLGVTVLVVGGAGLAAAQEPDWANMPYTSHFAYQVVDADGRGTFDVNDNPTKLRGIILNRPQDMLKGTAGAPGFMAGQWQLYLQAVDLDDQGGTAMWMGQNIGSIRGVPEDNYTNEQWVSEMNRLNHDPMTGRRFRPGDLVEVRARAPGMFNAGKTNVNEQHYSVPQQDFDVVLIQPGYGLPAATVITLADVKDAGDSFIFDATRATGAELYQATLVRISNVSFVSTAGWGPNGQLTIHDGSGRTLPVLLGRSRGFMAYPAPTGAFDIVGIFDQEDKNGDDGWKSAYRLWVMGYDGSRFLVPTSTGDTDTDVDVDLGDFMYFQACFNGPNRPAKDGYCDDFDFDFDGDVDLADFGAFQECLNGPNRPPKCG